MAVGPVTPPPTLWVRLAGDERDLLVHGECADGAAELLRERTARSWGRCAGCGGRLDEWPVDSER